MSENKNVVVVEGCNMGEAVTALKQQNLRALNFIEMIQQYMSMLFCDKFYDSATLLAFYGDWLIVDHRPNNPLLQAKIFVVGWLGRLIHYVMPLTQDYFDSALRVANSGSELVFVLPRSEVMEANGEHTLKDATKLVILPALCGGKKNAKKFLLDYRKETGSNTICIYFNEEDFGWESPVGRVVCCDHYNVCCGGDLGYDARFLGVQSTRAKGESVSSSLSVEQVMEALGEHIAPSSRGKVCEIILEALYKK